MITGSIFDNVRDNQPVAIPPVDFAELVEALVSEAFDCDPASKALQTCISPATYPDGVTRSKDRAISWTWFAADIDNKAGNLPGSTIDDIKEVMAGLGSPWFIYTTASSQPLAECFRLMFPLDRTVESSEFDAVWRAFAQLLPMDEQTKDISRIFIVPRNWEGRQNRMEYDLSGAPVSVDAMLQRFPQQMPAASSPRRVAATRPLGGTANRTAIPSLDAPYVPSNAVDEAISAPPGGRMYRFLIRVAFSALKHGYALDASDLEAVGRALAVLLGREAADIRHDARSAHAYAASSHHHNSRANRSDLLRSALTPRRFR